MSVNRATCDTLFEPAKRRLRDKPDLPYYGEFPCQAEQGCQNNAAWDQKGRFLCGVHAKRADRQALPRRSPQEAIALRTLKEDEHRLSVEANSKANRDQMRKGKVSLHRMRMMHNVPLVSGVLNVFPNIKHQSRSDGFGCMRLSPMHLGPVEHGQPGLPPALNIENFHQGSKCFPAETNPVSNDPTELFYQNRLSFYTDSVPHRHKFKKVIPCYFIWVDKDNKEHKLSYIESRQFYCNFYERLAAREQDFAKLCTFINEGTDICICGYDAAPLKPGESTEEAYLDPSRPFGHERVLFTMLSTEPNTWPWRKHKTFDF